MTKAKNSPAQAANKSATKRERNPLRIVKFSELVPPSARASRKWAFALTDIGPLSKLTLLILVEHPEGFIPLDRLADLVRITRADTLKVLQNLQEMRKLGFYVEHEHVFFCLRVK